VVDAGIFKNFRITEGSRLQLRGEMYNSFNHVNYGNPDTNVNSATFGRILGAASPRLIQVAARIQF
jgi:hypothetical protein